jgi:cation diffusion facilitator CzcD-associated flavoprotein CzcO
VSTLPSERADVVIVGAGPAGLTAARHLRASGVSSVLVLDREAQAGGIPRHSDHLGYGLRDLRTLLSARPTPGAWPNWPMPPEPTSGSAPRSPGGPPTARCS